MLLLAAALLAAFFGAWGVQAKAVFAHFMVGNTASFDASRWTYNIKLAQDAHIDAFALNMAYGWEDNEKQVEIAFSAAASAGFKLFFSFDYAGGSEPWPLETVRTFIRRYGKHAAHYQYKGLPLVSTFEGPGQADDWHTINSGDTSCFFIPDWSSLGAGPAVAAGNGVANGLFSWAAWPTGDINSTIYVDASYKLALGDKPYMMPVSPWFFTNMPGFDKNWLWNSGDLWHQRWQQLISLDFQPEFLQIISWNDYGESHYIGPLDDTQYEAFDRGKSPYNYARSKPHDGWRVHLPFYIDLYKTGTATVTEENLVIWFRTTLAGACADGETTGNTASQLQYEYNPLDLMPDRLYFSALLTSYAELRVTYAGTNYVIKDWDTTPDGGVGVYHTSIPISTTSGSWKAVVVRNGATVIDYMVGQGVGDDCEKGITNWNPVVTYARSSATVDAKPPRTIAEQECIEGWGPDNFAKLCSFTCSYGYCPSGACVCTNKGKARTKPKATGVTGYPANGDANYGGLCSFACNFGFCPSYACSTTPKPPYIPKTSPFNPTTCTGGQGSGSTSRLCSWACRYGFCPRHSCACTSRGPLKLPPPEQDVGKVTSNFGNDNGLCSFTCKRGFCPSPECKSEKGAASGSESLNTVVAYFQGRHILNRGCDRIPANFIPTDSVTHINVAFLWIDPDSFAVYPSRGFDTPQIQDITSLKRQAPGLRVWVTVGGWDFSNGKGAVTDTEAIFGKMAGSAANRAKFISNLAMFMRQYALDGVDIDWEWPGAADGANYAALVQDMRLYFDAHQPAGSGWGISFTTPLDTAVLARYDLTTMAASANWINLVAYDLKGSDTTTTHPSSDQRLFDAALAIFSNARVPTSQINLGLGFFGRSYTLSSGSCDTLTCDADGVGVVGSCTGTASFMSYKEIDQMISSNGHRPKYDKDVGTNYFTYGDKQWISYENPDTIIEKVKYAKSKGLLGVAIWSVELDNDSHDLLNATLYPVGLGGLSDHTGSGSDGSSDYVDATISSCSWSSCSTSQTPGCPAGQQVLTVDRCEAEPGTGKKRYKALCCPLDRTPDPDFCEWQGYRALGVCSTGCATGYVGMADDEWIIDSGGEGRCFLGRASYCCKVEQTGLALCGWGNRCSAIGANEQPVDDWTCSAGTKFVTYAKGAPGIGRCEGDASVNSWVSYCCNTQVDTSSFEWASAKGQANDCPTGCPSGKTMISKPELGGGADCYWVAVGMEYTMPSQFFTEKRPLCADPNALKLTVNTLPVPLKNLFPNPGPDTDKQKWHVELDPSMGGADLTPEKSTDPDDNSFGWYIMSGPPHELTSLNRRDGSHWELFDCHDAVDEGRRHTVRAVCTTEGSEDSNCGDIHLGRGVAGTVVEMPPSCGPGKYAMAVLLTPSANQTLPPRLAKRMNPGAQVYDFTFDYDFSPLQKRGQSNVLLRIDYSDDPGYWSTIVAAAPSSKRRKRSAADIHSEVKRDHGGSYKRYLNHLWEEDKRETPAHERHELHARWFSGQVADWIAKMRGVDAQYNLVRHRVDETVRWDLVDESVQCDFDNGISANGRFRAWADLNVNIETSAMLTLIGNLGDLSSFDQSHVFFRNKGSVQASFNLDALATASFMTGPMELFGLQNFGATFTVPGIVTIGPNFRILGSVDGSATLHGQARVDIKLADWDYTQQYPDKNGRGDDAITDAKTPTNPSVAAAGTDDPLGRPKFYYDVDVQGQLTLTVTPQITLGIVFKSSSVPDASVDLGVNGRVILYGSAGSSSAEAWRYCYGVNSNVDVFARISAPKLFNVDISNYYTIWQTGTFPIVNEVCAAAAPATIASRAALPNDLNVSGNTNGVGTINDARNTAISKRDGFLGSLLCPKSPSDLSEIPSCPLCGSDDGSPALGRRTRFGAMMEPRADSCIYVPPSEEETCSYPDSSTAKRGEETSETSIWERELQGRASGSDKPGTIDLGGGVEYDEPYPKYAPCGTAKNSASVLKNIVFGNYALACTPGLQLVQNNQVTGTDGCEVQTDHVFETQIISRFVEFLAGRSKLGLPTTYTMASSEWVENVILGAHRAGKPATRPIFDFDTAVLNFPPDRKKDEQHIWWVWGYGVGRSDGKTDYNPFNKPRGESHLVLVDKRVNEEKGTWFGLNKPGTTTKGHGLRDDRRKIRAAMGTFSYLRWAPPVTATDKFARDQPVWHKFMRVANWIDLVCYYADQQINWQLWTDGPKNLTGGPVSLRALWAFFIENWLKQIEATAAQWTRDAAADYKRLHGTQQGEPAWYNSAFGPRGWATPMAARFPRVPATNGGWSEFGVFANPDMTIDGQGNTVSLGPPLRI